jgi:hypothetical protein
MHQNDEKLLKPVKNALKLPQTVRNAKYDLGYFFTGDVN